MHTTVYTCSCVYTHTHTAAESFYPELYTYAVEYPIHSYNLFCMDMNHLLNRCMEYTIQNDLDSLLKLELGLLFTYIQWWIPLKKRGWCFQHLAIQYTQCKSIRIILWLNAGHCGPSLHEPTLTHTLALDDHFYPSTDKFKEALKDFQKPWKAVRMQCCGTIRQKAESVSSLHCLLPIKSTIGPWLLHGTAACACSALAAYNY